MRSIQVWVLLLALLLAEPAIAAEYRGKNIDGKRFAGKVYAYETGGVFDVQVEFRKKKAVLYFANGGQQTIRLKRSNITDPKNIVGWGRVGFLSLGGILSVGVADDSSNNTEPPRPRPFEGFWRISLNEADLN
ncbi:hypothetical protein [Altericista sp. CCNU0014]|uniref:hypothetical protein n=1 Tax=Altericista sp. CCNU0014 TaxID=3082949 RepID=UPI00384DF31B